MRISALPSSLSLALMDCRSFRKHHLGFVDDTLSGVDTRRMLAHLEHCAACATWDSQVRRSLMVVRGQVRDIAPSPGFQARLAARLEAERAQRHLMVASPRAGWFGWGSAVSLGAAMAFVAAGLMGVLWWADGSSVPPRLETVTAVVRSPDGLPSATPAFVASVSTGMAILPALMLSEEVSQVRGSGTGAEAVFRIASLPVVSGSEEP